MYTLIDEGGPGSLGETEDIPIKWQRLLQTAHSD